MPNTAVSRPCPQTLPIVHLPFCIALACIIAARTPAQDQRRSIPPDAIDGSDQAALVTGSGTSLHDQVAGGVGGARIELIPIPAKVGSYPPNTVIVDQEIIIDPWPTTTRLWFEFKVSGWDPDGNDILDGTGVCTDNVCTAGLDPLAGTPCLIDSDCDQPTLALLQAQIVGEGFNDADLDLDGDLNDDGDQIDIYPAIQQCSFRDFPPYNLCPALLGEPGALCLQSSPSSGVPGCPFSYCCTPMFVHPSNPRPDALWAGVEALAAADTTSPFHNFRLFALAVFPHVFTDDGTKKYGGTLVVDVPPGAAGRYSIHLDSKESYLMDRQSPPAEIPLVERSGASIRVRCASDKDCDDSDACTFDHCDAATGACDFPLIAGFDPSVDCCDSDSGLVRGRDDLDECTEDLCSLPDGRGAPSHPLLPAFTPCDDLRRCTLDDHCDGLHSQADGGCTGSPIPDLACGSSADCAILPGPDLPCVRGFCVCREPPRTVRSSAK